MVGKSTVGKRGDRQQFITRDAEDQDADHQQRSADRPADEDLGNIHCSACGRARRRLRLRDLDLAAVGQSILTIDHHARARLQALADDRQPFLRRMRRPRSDAWRRRPWSRT